jgi:hypothetical protein
MWVTGGVPATQLRKMMLEELQRRNYSENTTRCYIRTVEDFSPTLQLFPGSLKRGKTPCNARNTN